MTTTMIRSGMINQLAAVLDAQEQEIHRYRLGETLLARRALAWERAADEWLDQHFQAWKRSQWELAVTEAMQCAYVLN